MIFIASLLQSSSPRMMPPFLFLLAFFTTAAAAGDTITPSQPLFDGQTLVSSSGVFELGFFSPMGSKNRYLGLWYHNIPDHTIVWVANRDAPLASSGGVFTLTVNGALVLHDPTGYAVWSTNTSTSAVANPVAKIFDTGNLVVSEGSGIVWQSFDHPTDTFLPGMKLGWNLKTNTVRYLTAWKSDSDPSSGAFSYRLDRHGVPQVYIWKGRNPVYRAGPWNKDTFGGSPMTATTNSSFTFSFVYNEDEAYYTCDLRNSSVLTRMLITQNAVGERFVWADNEWRLYWKLPLDNCGAYNMCGVYGVCNPSGVPLCGCLTGFQPRSPASWALGDSSGGCVRTAALHCGSDDGFLKMSGMKLPDTWNATMARGMSLDGCREICMKNCSCLAFAMSGYGSDCLMWPTDLTDLTQYSGGGQDLYIRLAASEIAKLEEKSKKNKRRVLIVEISVPLAVLFLGIFVWLFMKRLRKGNCGNGNAAKDRLIDYDLLLFAFSAVAKSTNNFSDENKLGEGGFGAVYKGKLPNGTEVAVKRLSKGSGQGIEEFANEIRLIAKLQHKNLVRLLGCCVRGDERLLIYEYMPNKSLDCFLFDSRRRKPLDWKDRLRIIDGVAQGLLYLHKYSRLKIIHRDLKTSNILLDAEMNPKISDFGIARIFSANQAQEKTNIVIGTYGYMPPEYAIQGLFSEKSDVFSFGVLLLEILSGKKNGHLLWVDDSCNLLTRAWECWKTERIVELMDPVLRESCPLHELTQFVHIALLCVQANAIDRPDMQSVLSLLSGNTESLPSPRSIAFCARKYPGNANANSPIDMLDDSSSNMLTITVIEPR